MRSTNEQSRLQVGQVLKRPLCHPVSGNVLVAPGVVLSPLLIERIERLRLQDAALGCVELEPTVTLPPAPPMDDASAGAEVARAELQEQSLRLEELLIQGVSVPVDPAAAREHLGAATGTIESILVRLQRLDRRSLPDLRIHGGGEFTHPINVMLLSAHMGLHLQLAWPKLVALAQAALLHDVGERMSRRSTARSGTPAGAKESHPAFGVEVVKQLKRHVPALKEDVLLGVHAHHERWDGGGYPLGWQGTVIPLVARILAVADAYETMTADRPGRPRMLPGDAYQQVVALAGRAFDPDVVSAFRQVVVPYPARTILRLRNGQMGQVLRQGSDLLHPVLLLGHGEGELDLGRPGAPADERHHLPRRHPRAPRDVAVTVHDPATESCLAGRSLDVSSGGIGLVLERGLVPGAAVRLTVAVPEAEALTLSAVVAWATGARVGLNLPWMPPRLRDAWHALVRRGD